VEALKYRDKLPLIMIRPPMVYGPKDKGVFVIIQTVAKGLSPVLKASSDPKGLKYYSAVHSSDLCRGIILAAQLPAEQFQSGETFYLSGDEVLSYRDLLGGIAEVLGKKTLTFPLPPLVLKVAAALSTLAGYFTPKTFPLNWDKLNEILPDYWICSNEKAKTLLGFKPEFSFKDGMKDTIAWYRENKWL
jgi:nucleoside-diphosphate-sugar epimerase